MQLRIPRQWQHVLREMGVVRARILYELNPVGGIARRRDGSYWGECSKASGSRRPSAGSSLQFPELHCSAQACKNVATVLAICAGIGFLY